MPDDGWRNCLKPVEFHSKNKFEKSVHLVGFIMRNIHEDSSLLGYNTASLGKWFLM
jgi:hypothetical protein